MDYMDMFLFVILVFTEILGVFTQGIPADRTFEVCTGSRVTMTFEGANYNQGDLESWHFTSPGSKEVDVALEFGTSPFQPVTAYKGYGLEKVGRQGIVIPNISANDSGLYRFNQDANFRYNVTVKDPCLESTDPVPQEDEMCLKVQCMTKATFQRLEIGDVTDQVTQNPYTLCGTSVVTVTCVVEQGGQELTDMTTFDLTTRNENGDDNGEKKSGELSGGEIAGIAVGAAGFTALTIAMFCVVLKKRDNSRG
ncbi:uncharacterized protein LOC110462196 isoform X2 [Mizuhopecten yessoensis]|nr:uncharacterized protein LOC110462196 isoform X2 [Mizuhopecten yessoensis]